ncbi:hypothetical protein L7F22_056404 [Adiantum nelumboides]|nr:hypothetical protein [Adiantum nelumboides]
MASGEGQSNPSTSGDAGGNHHEGFGNEYGPPLPTQEELREMEHRRLVGEATNLMMLNFAKDPKLAKHIRDAKFIGISAQLITDSFGQREIVKGSVIYLGILLESILELICCQNSGRTGVLLQDTASFIKKSRGNKNMRKRPVELEDDEDDEENKDDGGSAVLHKAKSSRSTDGNLVFSSQATPSVQEQEKKTFFYDSTREIQTQSDSRATATLETETEFDKDARSIRERVLKQADQALRGKKPQDDKVYKGLHGYTDHKAGFRREHTIAGEKAGGAHGPLRASSHIRWSVRFDYQPDICKDYKETGYCGYGDACKFMHDRGDYKSGWQMDREWEEGEKKRKAKLAQRIQDEEEDSADEEVDDSLPFGCMICRQPFVDPVVTLCKHYFCEHCALKHHARDKHCHVCNKATNGTFNTAMEILKRGASERSRPAGLQE